MLAQTWITHPHPDHTGGAKSLFHGFLESPIYGESDIDVATHTVTAGTQFPFGEGLVTVWATPRPYRPPHQLSAGKFRRPACFLRRYLVLRRLRPRIYRHNRAALRQFPPLQPTARRNAVLSGARIYSLQPALCPAYRAGQCRHQTALAAAEHTPTLPVSLAHERKVNPFFRVHLPQVQARAEELSGRKLNSELEIFAALRELKNQF